MDLYSQEFIYNYKNPQHKTDIKDLEIKGTSANLSCGDSIDFGINVVDGNISQIAYDGTGCIVALASAELLAQTYDKGKLNDVKKVQKDDFLNSLGFELTPSRQKCALVAFNAFKNAVEKADTK